MNIDQTVFAVAGVMILTSLVFGLLLHPYWFALAAFVGLNMFQTAFTGYCPLAIMLKKIGLTPGKAFK